MPAVDALTLAALAEEFRGELNGARVDDVIQPTPHAVALQCYGGGGGGRNRWLLASAHPQLARIHLVGGKPRKLTTEPPAFVMLLRKYLEGARIAAIRQPRWERMLEIGFGRGPSVAEGVTTAWLVVEIMGQISNLILRGEDGVILGALHQVSAEVNRYRAIMPHIPYRYPPPQTRTLRGETLPRLSGETVTSEQLREAALSMVAAAAEPPAPSTGRRKGRSRREAPTVAGLLASQVEGFSRELGHEIAARALASPDEPLAPDLPWERVAKEARMLAALPETGAWQPTLVYGDASNVASSGTTSEEPTAFAVYLPRQFDGADLRATASVNEMLATFYHDAEWRLAVDGARRELRHLLQTVRDRCIRKDEALRGELAAIAEAQALREEADLLLAFQADIARGQQRVTLENPFGEGTTRTLTLDPRFTVVENANRRYARYHKLQRATSLIPPQIEANQLELARVEQLLTDLALAETPAEIALVRAEVVEAGLLRGEVEKQPPKKAPKPPKWAKGKPGKAGASAKAAQPRKPEGGAPLRRESSDGMTLLVGKNSRQNEEVTFHQASANDTWLHARGVPGAHVIIRNGGRPVSDTTLREAAALAAYYSQSRAAGSVPVDYTEQRYVRHMKGGGPGMVIYERERTLHVTPGDPSA